MKAIEIRDEPMRIEHHIDIARPVSVKVTAHRIDYLAVTDQSFSQPTAGDGIGNPRQAVQLGRHSIFHLGGVKAARGDHFAVQIDIGV